MNPGSIDISLAKNGACPKPRLTGPGKLHVWATDSIMILSRRSKYLYESEVDSFVLLSSRGRPAREELAEVVAAKNEVTEAYEWNLNVVEIHHRAGWDNDLLAGRVFIHLCVL